MSRTKLPNIDQTKGGPWKLVRIHPKPSICQGKFNTMDEAKTEAEIASKGNEKWDCTRV